MRVYIVVEEIGGVAEIPYVTVDENVAEKVWRELVIGNCSQFDEIEVCENFENVPLKQDSDDFVYDEKTGLYYHVRGDSDYYVKVLLEEVKDISTIFGKEK